jgi:hypothetical protein
MLDEPPIRMRTLLLKGNLNPMIRNPPSQTFKADS